MNEIQTAIKMETDAVAYYTSAAELTSHPVGKRMFLSIAEDEKRHIEYLNTVLSNLELKAAPVNPMEKINTIFSELKDQLGEHIKATTDETGVLKVAMKMEQEGFEFYKRLSTEHPDEKYRKLFSVLMLEEQKHFEVFSNTYSFLTDTGNWFMWSEHSIVEG